MHHVDRWLFVSVAGAACCHEDIMVLSDGAEDSWDSAADACVDPRRWRWICWMVVSFSSWMELLHRVVLDGRPHVQRWDRSKGR